MHNEDVLCGFRLHRRVALNELEGELLQFTHEQTGLELVWLKRKDDNKTFGIAFETLPEDDTGVFHILEHSVLCGSDRYPVKEPFVELMKSSMNTFLNAMTFPDKTFYPISSRNDTDFLNLMRVYLDAVFHPAIYRKPEIFRQEGWSYAFDETGLPSYKGVVLNEMKGAFSDPDEQVSTALNRALFPDTPYAFVSGGDPVSIPDLTYEKFLEAHRRFYSPSNAYVILDGDVDLEIVMKILDEEYLSDFGQTERVAPPPLQTAAEGGSHRLYYEIGADEAAEGRVRLFRGRVIGSWSDRTELTGVKLLADVLAGNNHAPLKRALLDRELAEDVSLDVIDGVSQPYTVLSVRNLREENIDRVNAVLDAELERLAEQGLDRLQLESAIARMEFNEREQDYGSYPKGLMLEIRMLSSLLYGGEPEKYLEAGNLYEDLRKKVDEGWFEDLLRRILIINPHRADVIQLPSADAGEERRTAERSRLERERAAWSPEETARLRKEQEQLLAWQNREDSPEALAALPHLSPEDIAGMLPEELPTLERETCGISVLEHRVPANGIRYISLWFDAGCFSAEELPALGFLCSLQGKLPTEKTSADRLNARIGLLLGQFDCYVSAFSDIKTGKTSVKVCVSYSTLEKNLREASELVAEILTGTRYIEEEIRSLLRQQIEEERNRFIMSGHSAAIGRVAARFTAEGAANEYANGLEAYLWKKRAVEQETELCTLLEELPGRAFRANALTISSTASDALPEFMAELFAAALPVRNLPNRWESALPEGRSEGIVIPSDICFAVSGGSVGTYTGEYPLCARISSLDYLWNSIRVTGGAYGAGMVTEPNGMIYCYSYRDPNGRRSLEQYKDCGRQLREFCGEGCDLNGFIIGAVSDASPVLTPRMIGMTADTNYWQGISYEERCENRRKLLKATPETLTALSRTIDDALADSCFCVIGGKEQIAACSPEQVINL